MRGNVSTAVTAGVALLLGMFVTADAATVRVRCETRGDRSKISVDGNNLAAGSYTARATSGGVSAMSGVQPAVGDEAEFDFDSDNNQAAGTTRIGASFIKSNTVLGEILDAGGSPIASSTVGCRAKN